MSAKVEADTKVQNFTADESAKVASGSSGFKLRDLGKSLSAAQVRLRANKRYRTIVAWTVIWAVFVDILGTAIIAPPLPALVAYAEGGPVDTIMEMPFPGTPEEQKAAREAVIAETINPYAFKDPKPPVGYSLSINLVLSFGQVGSAFGSLLFGKLCDTVGCKIPMQLCLFMGIFGYVMILVGGKHVESYYLFALGCAWNNFFGNTMGIASIYFGQMFEGSEKDGYIGTTMGMAMIGASLGALIVMPFVLNPTNGANYFNSLYLAMGLTIFTFILVSFVLVPPEKKEQEKVEATTPKLARKILIIVIIASALDSAGDEGTRMARGTIMSTLFPEWSTVSRQNYLLIAVIGVVMVTLVIMNLMRMCFNLGVIAVFGCVATLATQLLLMLDSLTAAPYIILWHVGKLFGFLSSFGSSFIIQEIAPKELLGYWNGRNDALTNLTSAIAPLIFAAVYDHFKNPRGSEMLACTAAVSFLAICAYAPLCTMLPKPPPEKKDEDELKDLTEYENMTDEEFSQLPLELTDKLQLKWLEAGKPPRFVSWGSYHAERHLLSGVRQRALKDFKYVSNSTMLMLTNRSVLAQEQENLKKFMDGMPKVDREQAKQQMGAWMADYLDDAGYLQWETQCQIFKAMIMTALPPIDPLDAVKPDFATMPLDKLEDNATTFLGVMDDLLAVEQRRVPQKVSVGTFFNLFRRR